MSAQLVIVVQFKQWCLKILRDDQLCRSVLFLWTCGSEYLVQDIINDNVVLYSFYDLVSVLQVVRQST
jgi:hypothetical protein